MSALMVKIRVQCGISSMVVERACYLSAAGHGLGRRGGLHITALGPGTSVLRGVSQRATGRLSPETGV